MLRNLRSFIHALVAQQVEHHHGKVGVSGSNPDKGSISLVFKQLLEAAFFMPVVHFGGRFFSCQFSAWAGFPLLIRETGDHRLVWVKAGLKGYKDIN